MLFEQNSYQKEFDEIITEIIGNKIYLNNTLFYAKGGGQPGDKGILLNSSAEIKVLDTIKDEAGKIVHVCEDIKNLKAGDKIKGIIDWATRYKHMRMHSALHVLCAVVPYGITGGQVGFNKSRIDFDIEGNPLNKGEIENKINEIINKNYLVEIKSMTNEELDSNPDIVRTMSVKPPKSSTGKIRLIKIGNVDIQPCGGTHVKNTSEIGKITISKIENKGKRNKRVNLLLD